MQFSVLVKCKFRPFATLTVASSKKYVLTHFQKLKPFHLLMTQDSLLGKVLRENFFRPEMQWTGFTDIGSELFIHTFKNNTKLCQPLFRKSFTHKSDIFPFKWLHVLKQSRAFDRHWPNSPPHPGKAKVPTPRDGLSDQIPNSPGKENVQMPGGGGGGC